MNIAVILAGGTGTRMGGDIPKQYHEVADRPIIAYCMQTLEEHTQIDAIQIVAEETWRPLIQRWAGEKLRGFSKPGVNRQLSILNALEDIETYASSEDVVLIQDAARPNTSEKLISECVRLAPEEDGRMPVLPMKDTVYLSEDGSRVSSLLCREQVFAGQAPEAFRFGKYLQANRALLPDRILQMNGSTEPAVLSGLNISMITGEEENYKITTMEDFNRFCRKVENG